MSQTTVNFRIDSELKEDFEKTCKSLGLNITSAFTVFATKVVNEQRIPFEISIDPFYSERNIKRLKKSIEELEKTGGTIHEVDYYKIMV